MKKLLFLMILPFLLLGTARVSAQVRIGGSTAPHNAAVLDLNVDDGPTPSGNRGGLALPRVALTSNNMPLHGADPVNGMLVYHTGSTLDGAGVYIWMTDKWVKASTGYTGSTSIALDGLSFVRKALSGDVTAGENSNETIIADDAVTSAKIMDSTIIGLDIAPNEIQTAHLVDNAVTGNKIDTTGAVAGNTLTFDGQTWAPAELPGSMGAGGGGRYVSVSRRAGYPFEFSGTDYMIPIGCKPGENMVGYFQPVGSTWWNEELLAYRDGEIRTIDGFVVCGQRVACTCIFLTF